MAYKSLDPFEVNFKAETGEVVAAEGMAVESNLEVFRKFAGLTVDPIIDLKNIPIFSLDSLHNLNNL